MAQHRAGMQKIYDQLGGEPIGGDVLFTRGEKSASDITDSVLRKLAEQD